MEVTPDNLKNAFRMIREFQGLKQKDVAAKANIAPSVISYVEINQGSSSLETIEKIANALGYKLIIKFVPIAAKNITIDDQSNILAND